MRLTATFLRFARSEQFGGILLLACTAASLVVASSPAASTYDSFWNSSLGPMSLQHWINDALMAVFFLLIGLELERELYVGELADIRNAMLPVFAAVGGMVAPALIHYAFNVGEVTEPGFGIPMATDIAFALGILTLLGTRLPTALKVFVVAFAVIDDLGAVVLIALVYTKEVEGLYLGLALATWGLLIAANRPFRIMSLTPYVLGGAIMWFCFLKAGVHASIAGVLLAFAIPFTPRVRGKHSPSHVLEHRLHAPVAYCILPLFALANTAVPLDGSALAALAQDNSLGIVLGLVIGKPVGITLMCLIAVACGVCALPEGVRWKHIIGAGCLGGIGFTMSIFITNLAFGADPGLANSSKRAVLFASVVAGTLGYLWLRALKPEPVRSS